MSYLRCRACEHQDKKTHSWSLPYKTRIGRGDSRRSESSLFFWCDNTQSNTKDLMGFSNKTQNIFIHNKISTEIDSIYLRMVHAKFLSVWNPSMARLAWRVTGRDENMPLLHKRLHHWEHQASERNHFSRKSNSPPPRGPFQFSCTT